MAADRGNDSAEQDLSSGGFPAILILHVSFPSPFRCWSAWEGRDSQSGEGFREEGYSSRVTLSACHAHLSRTWLSVAHRRAR